MRDLQDAPELEAFEQRVKSNYGRGTISFADHNQILNKIDELRELCEEAKKNGSKHNRTGSNSD